MQNIELYSLQPKQEQFANLTCKYRLFGGAKGGGKSYAMRAEAVRQCLSAPMIRGLVLRRTSPEIRENMIIPMQRELPSESTGFYKMNNSDGIMTFFNGSTIRFSYCQNMKDVLRYQGLEYDFICIEELTHWHENEFKILMGCLRSSRKGIIPNFFGSTNPGGLGHKWVKRLFVDRDFKKGENPKNYGFVSAKVWDNLVLMETQPEYVEDLQSLPDKERQAYLEGDWNVFDGQYFTEFRTDLHVVQATYPIVGVRRRIICLDYGYAAPSAVYWLAEYSDGQVRAYRELYVTKHTYFQLATRIKALTKEDEEIIAIVVDPAIVNKSSETTGTTGADEFKRVGFKVIGADNSRIAGRQIVRKYLQPFEEPNTKEIKTMLTIGTNCNNLINTLPFMIHDKTNVEDIDTTQEDHASDALRYGLKFLAGNSSSLHDIKTINDVLTKTVENEVKKSKTSLETRQTDFNKKERDGPEMLEKKF